MKNLNYTPVDAVIVPEIINDAEILAVDVEYLPDPPVEVIIDLPEEEADFANEADVVLVAEEEGYFLGEEDVFAMDEEFRAEEERRQQEFVDDMNTMCLMAAVCLL